jgi:hypothetical protein
MADVYIMDRKINSLLGRVAALESHRSDLHARIVALEKRLAEAPIAYMDTRPALALCAMKEEDFAALYALQGKRVRLVVVDDDATPGANRAGEDNG